MKSFKRKNLFLLSFAICAAAPLSILFTNCSQASFEAAESLGDPFLEYAWHIKNTGQKVFSSEAGTAGIDLNLTKTWNSGITGRGVRILVSDDGIEDTHQDLSANYLYGGVSRDYTLAHPYTANSSGPKDKDDNHGTAVAGLIAAVANNGYGSKGVAFGASLVSANFLTAKITATQSILLDQVGGDFDVFNMSWGSTQNAIAAPHQGFQTQLRSGALTLRNGKGAIYVKAAGNNFSVTCGNGSGTCLGNSSFDADNSSPHLILVGALNAKGEAASYSSPGSNLWISSFGGEFGDDSPAMITTDRTTCSLGFSVSNSSSSVSFEKGANGNTACTYTSAFNGTSSAAPVLSGVVALLLEANPKLTWRDVKYILAKTAVQIFPEIDVSGHPTNDTLPSGMDYEHPWVTNKAGFKFHNWFGFGRVNVDAAVALAKNYTSPFGTFVEVDFLSNSQTATVAIPDFSYNANGQTATMSVSNKLKIESVQLKLNISHTNISQLAIELISPEGTSSYLVNAGNALRGQSGYVDYVLQSNAFYQEKSDGVWKLRVTDGVSGISGNLTNWSLRFTGSAY